MQGIESLEAELQRKSEAAIQLVRDHNLIQKMYEILSWEGKPCLDDSYKKVLRLTCPAGVIKIQKCCYTFSDRYKVILNNEEVFSAKTGSEATNISDVHTLRQKGSWFRWLLDYYPKAKAAYEQKQRLNRIKELEEELRNFD